jgi:serine/threonine protein kinase
MIPGHEKFNHPNVIKTLGAGKTGTDDNLTHCYLVTELVARGTLYDLIEQIGPLDEMIARNVFKQCLEGLNYVHNRGVCHRDVKLENFFVSKEYQVKLGDFGSCKKFNEIIDGQPDQSAWGSEFYKAPENMIGPGVDVFSLGVLLYLILSASFPFE